MAKTKNERTKKAPPLCTLPLKKKERKKKGMLLLLLLLKKKIQKKVLFCALRPRISLLFMRS